MAKFMMLTQRRRIKPETVHPVLIEEDDGGLTLVDCGDPGLAGGLLEEIRRMGYPLERLTNIIVTHHDLDHMGGLSQLRDMLPHVNVMTSPIQAEYISGKQRWLRLQAEDWDYLSRPPEKRELFQRARAEQYRDFLPARVDTLLYDGQELPIGGGCRVLYTSWHMPEHISLYFPEEKALVSGDALNTFDGTVGLNSHVDLCPEFAPAGLLALSVLEVEHIYGYHGGLLNMSSGQFSDRLKGLISMIRQNDLTKE